ncbi:hypothetical protein ACTRXD_16935 [Nitrospira sp. T9]|uniref:hypothetical protein n=1 Tax=unclassified Nitrospira TaxID=2652172 RepID=UPI003F96DAF2
MDEKHNEPGFEEARAHFTSLDEKQTAKEILEWLSVKCNQWTLAGVKPNAITSALKALLLSRSTTSTDERLALGGDLVNMGAYMLAYPEGQPQDHEPMNPHVLIQLLQHTLHEYSLQGFNPEPFRNILEGVAKELKNPRIEPDLN